MSKIGKAIEIEITLVVSWGQGKERMGNDWGFLFNWWKCPGTSGDTLIVILWKVIFPL